MTSINATEAAVFRTECALRGLSTDQAIDLLSRTSWPTPLGDETFGCVRHTPTIRRLAKPLLMTLDAERASRAAQSSARDAEQAVWASMSAAARAEVLDALAGAQGRASNARARQVALRHGLTVSAASVDALRALVRL